MSESLLPYNATALERAIETVTTLPLPIHNAALWNPNTCPVEFLPWLANTLSVDYWNSEWPEGVKRNVLAMSVEIHRKKGTPASIRAVLNATGFGGATILEGYGGISHDGSVFYDGSETYGEADQWAEYRIYLTRPITNEQADEVRRLLMLTAPARCSLKGLYFTLVAHTYNGEIIHDGTYNYGAA